MIIYILILSVSISRPFEIENFYDFMHDNRGIALIFNHETISDQPKRNGTLKDGKDLKAILERLNFDVRDHMDLNFQQIKDILHNGKTLKLEVEYFMNLFLFQFLEKIIQIMIVF